MSPESIIKERGAYSLERLHSAFSFPDPIWEANKASSMHNICLQLGQPSRVDGVLRGYKIRRCPTSTCRMFRRGHSSLRRGDPQTRIACPSGYHGWPWVCDFESRTQRATSRITHIEAVVGHNHLSSTDNACASSPQPAETRHLPIQRPSYLSTPYHQRERGWVICSLACPYSPKSRTLTLEQVLLFFLLCTATGGPLT